MYRVKYKLNRTMALRSIRKYLEIYKGIVKLHETSGLGVRINLKFLFGVSSHRLFRTVRKIFPTVVQIFGSFVII